MTPEEKVLYYQQLVQKKTAMLAIYKLELQVLIAKRDYSVQFDDPEDKISTAEKRIEAKEK
jgi:hypothetical protein